MNLKKFQRRQENFTCENCGFFVEGNGYTNHCPKCLFSKHVDKNPGDRQSKCFGLMKPISIEKTGDSYSIIHQCLSCNTRKKNKISKKDNFNAVLKISKNLIYQGN